jgi:hypothetical protein
MWPYISYNRCQSTTPTYFSWIRLLGQALGVVGVLLLADGGFDTLGGTGVSLAATLLVQRNARVLVIVPALAVPLIYVLADETFATPGGAVIVLATALLTECERMVMPGHGWCCAGMLGTSACDCT